MDNPITSWILDLEHLKAMGAVCDWAAFPLELDRLGKASTALPDVQAWEIEAARGLDLASKEGGDEYRRRRWYHSTSTIARAVLAYINDVATPAPVDAHYAVASSAIGEESVPMCRNMLALEVCEHARRFASTIGPVCADSVIHDEDGRLWLDERLARYLDSIGAKGREIAALIRRNSSSRWGAYAISSDPAPLLKLWIDLDDPPLCSYWAVNLAIALWEDEVKRRWEYAQKLKTAAPPRALIESVTQVFARNGHVEEDSRLVCRRREIATFDPDRLQELRRRGPYVTSDLIEQKIQALGTSISHDLFLFLLQRGFVQYVWRRDLEGNRIDDFRRIEIVGGVQALRSGLGSKAKNDDVNLRNALDALHFLKLPIGKTGHASLLMWNEIPHAPNRRAIVQITLDDAMIPGFSSSLIGTSRQDRADRLCVPVLPLDVRPRLVGDRKYYGAQRNLVLVFLNECANRSVEMAEKGGIWAPRSAWMGMADRAGLPSNRVDEVRSSLLEPCEGSLFSLLTLEGNDVYAIGDAFGTGRDFLMEQGRYRMKDGLDKRERNAQKARRLQRQASSPRHC